MLEQGTAPEIIPCGSKVMSIVLPCLSLRVIDSYNFLPMALSKLPACFGIEELTKGFFPHLFNTPENQNYIGPVPDSKYYCPDSMSSQSRKSFFAWHAEQKDVIFNFQDEILSYCR